MGCPRKRPFTRTEKTAKEVARKKDYYITHKDEFIIRNRIWYDKNRSFMSEKYKTTARECKYLYKYGITRKEAELMLRNQNNKCAICGCSILFDGNMNSAHTDHDHISNTVRGILCMNCNHGLGSFKDNIIILFNAINYLRSFSNWGKKKVS